MGKRMGTIETLGALGLDAFPMDSETDNMTGDIMTVARKGTVVVTVLESAQSHIQVSCHDHDSEEEATACLADVMTEVRHGLAERDAILAARDATLSVARSQIPNLSGMYV